MITKYLNKFDYQNPSKGNTEAEIMKFSYFIM